jgi:hypothetical protein
MLRLPHFLTTLGGSPTYFSFSQRLVRPRDGPALRGAHAGQAQLREGSYENRGLIKEVTFLFLS